MFLVSLHHARDLSCLSVLLHPFILPSPSPQPLFVLLLSLFILSCSHPSSGPHRIPVSFSVYSTSSLPAATIAERRIISADQFPKFPNLFSLKSPVIREVLQRRMMGNYAGLEICFANLASPSLFISHSFCLWLQSLSFSLSASSSLFFISSSLFLSLSQGL